jgi:hypothetical protein
MRDKIELAIKEFRKTYSKNPKILIIDNNSYQKLKAEVLGEDSTEQDITEFAGLIVHIESLPQTILEVI